MIFLPVCPQVESGYSSIKGPICSGAETIVRQIVAGLIDAERADDIMFRLLALASDGPSASPASASSRMPT